MPERSERPDPLRDMNRKEAQRKRSRASRLAELALWIGVALLTAFVLVQLSERILPTNF